MNFSSIKILLNKFKNKKSSLTFYHKKNNYYIRDGIINYNIDTKNLTCPCSNNLCEHIIYFLTDVIGININNLYFYNKFKKELSNYLEESKDITFINNKINEYINSECDCIICFCPIIDTKYNNIYVECNNCNNFCHKYCFDLYKSKNGIINNTCIYCKNGNFLL